MIRHSGPYEIEQIAPSAFAVDNDRDESMYLVRGRDRSIMIDTGSDPTPLLPVIRGIWDGPADLVLTHAHFDHMGQADAFRSVSLHRADIEAWNILGPVVYLGALGSGCPFKRVRIRAWQALEDGDALSLGDRCLRVIHAPGHTPGSILLADDEQKLLFTGDAFGSGSFAWMWMPGCLNLSAYRQSLTRLLTVLAPRADYRMFGGHRRQGIPTGEEPLAGPLCLDTVRDLESLCTAILDGHLEPEGSERNFGVNCVRYRLGRAALVLTKSKIR